MTVPVAVAYFGAGEPERPLGSRGGRIAGEATGFPGSPRR